MVNRSAIGRTVDALVSAVEMNIIRPPEIIKEKPSVTRPARKTEDTLLTWLHLFCHGLREEQRPLHVSVERGVKFLFACVGQPRVAHHRCVENQDVWWPKTPQTLVQQKPTALDRRHVRLHHHCPPTTFRRVIDTIRRSFSVYGDFVEIDDNVRAVCCESLDDGGYN